MYHRRPTNRLRIAALPAAAFALMLSGCSPDKDYGTLAGTVTYRGRPVTGLRVEVHRDNSGISTYAELDAEGKFALEGPIPTGPYELAVAPIPLADPSLAGAMRATAIPKKYGGFKTSGLTADVKKGANDVLLELKD